MEIKYRYWLVRKENLKYFKNVSQMQLNIWRERCDEYGGFIYITEYYTNSKTNSKKDSKYGYMKYKKASIEYFIGNHCEYMGIFGIREDRLKKLKKLSNL